ncbi:MAG: RHS repeat-associated core domain-containing protein, partial [Clostridiaceae bacterium]|nr:RHS repeat-associated core domain-containing protein [Clostridiaceae bacterium]
YLPFGRMLGSGVGGRGSCYPDPPDANYDSRAPQKFTGKERDETGLDYFGARYYSGSHGRFTSPDPLLNSGRPWQPQSWNRYAYTLNNPLKFVDPTGFYEWAAECETGGNCEAQRKRFRAAHGRIKEALDKAPPSSQMYWDLMRVIKMLGEEGDPGILVAFDNKISDYGYSSGGMITINLDLLDQEIDRILASGRAADRDIETAGVVVHEVTHEYLSFGRPDKYISFPFHQVLQDEKSAYRAQSAIYILLDTISMHGLHDPSWTMADAPKLREKAINENAKNSTEKARQAHGRRSGKK